MFDRPWLFMLSAILLLALPCNDLLASNIVISGISIDSDGDFPYLPAIKIILLLTVLSLAPSLLVVATSFTRIIIVLSILRHAMGMQNTPPNIVIITLSLFLTLFVMQPVIKETMDTAVTPYENGEINDREFLHGLSVPIKMYMIKRTREKDLLAINKMSGHPLPKNISDISIWTLIPAYMMSELFVAFQIGFIIFLPFLLVDIVVASILMSMGMLMVPPMMISLPIKIMLFVLIDGWNLIAMMLFKGLVT